jgi:hypothetical protein
MRCCRIVPKSHSRFERPSSERTLLHQRKRQSGVENRVDTGPAESTSNTSQAKTFRIDW